MEEKKSQRFSHKFSAVINKWKFRLEEQYKKLDITYLQTISLNPQTISKTLKKINKL